MGQNGPRGKDTKRRTLGSKSDEAEDRFRGLTQVYSQSPWNKYTCSFSSFRDLLDRAYRSRSCAVYQYYRGLNADPPFTVSF